ncbi:MAG: hypothetical protein AB7O47_09140 [Flavobacteriales bacterium]
MSNDTLSQKIIEWAATRSDDTVLHPTKGYYSFDAIAEAYKQGYEHGENNLKEVVRKKFFSNAKLISKDIDKVLKKLSKDKFSPNKIFIDLSFDRTKVLISISEDIYISNSFIDEMYSFVSNIQTDLFDKGINADIGFINDNRIIDKNLMECDGFGIGFDFNSNKPLY